jgi:hypothetical protein
MLQPGEKMNQISPHYGSLKKTLGKIINGLDDTIFFGLKRWIAVDDRQNHRCRSTTKMLIPSRGTGKQVTSLKDSFRNLGLVEPFN